MLPFQRITILGLGLIGSSLARALAEHDIHVRITSYDTNPDAGKHGLEHHYVHTISHDPVDAVKDAQLVIFATPPFMIEGLMQKIAPHLPVGVIVSDVASVKAPVVAAIRTLLPAHAHLVPAHPIAGSEKTGALAGRADLFVKKRIILTPQETDLVSEPVARVAQLWEAIGATVDYMPDTLHDRIYAYVSHLPQLVAFAAAKIVPDAQNAGITRLSHSHPVLWADICLMNAHYVDEALGDFITYLSQMTGELSEHEDAAVSESQPSAASLLAVLLATCLIACTAALEEEIGVNPARFAGNGFADMAAAALDAPETILASVSDNAESIATLSEPLLKQLSAIQHAVKTGNATSLVSLLGQ